MLNFPLKLRSFRQKQNAEMAKPPINQIERAMLLGKGNVKGYAQNSQRPIFSGI
jgi:hypothetical protein